MSLSKKQDILTAFRSVFRMSSIHSFPNMAENKSTFIKYLWLISFIASFCGCSYTIYRSVTSYFQFEVISRTETKSVNDFNFPMIKICNLNPFKTDYAFNILKELINHKDEINLDLNGMNNKLNETDPYFIQSNYIRNIFYLQYLSLVASINFNESERKKFDQNLDKILISCVYSNEVCDKLNDFEYFYDVFYGNCFKFNSGKNLNGSESKIRKISQTGLENGLMLELFLFEPSNENFFSILEGFNIFITEQNVDEISVEGIYVPSGFSTNIILDKRVNRKAPKPYSNCTSNLSSIDSYDSILYKKVFNAYGVYKKRKCLRLCLQKTIEENCNCTDITSIPYDGKRPCATSKDHACNLVNNRNFIKENLFQFCDCPSKCLEVTYKYSSSMVQYPTKNYARVLAKNPTIKSNFDNKADITYLDLREKIVSINIFFNQIEETLLTESPKTMIPDLTASIGGILGLFLGMSLLSFVEILEIFLKILLVLLKKN
jgi:hypothetical protein